MFALSNNNSLDLNDLKRKIQEINGKNQSLRNKLNREKKEKSLLKSSNKSLCDESEFLAVKNCHNKALKVVHYRNKLKNDRKKSLLLNDKNNFVNTPNLFGKEFCRHNESSISKINCVNSENDIYVETQCARKNKPRDKIFVNSSAAKEVLILSDDDTDVYQSSQNSHKNTFRKKLVCNFLALSEKSIDNKQESHILPESVLKNCNEKHNYNDNLTSVCDNGEASSFLQDIYSRSNKQLIESAKNSKLISIKDPVKKSWSKKLRIDLSTDVDESKSENSDQDIIYLKNVSSFCRKDETYSQLPKKHRKSISTECLNYENKKSFKNKNNSNNKRKENLDKAFHNSDITVLKSVKSSNKVIMNEGLKHGGSCEISKTSPLLRGNKSTILMTDSCNKPVMKSVTKAKKNSNHYSIKKHLVSTVGLKECDRNIIPEIDLTANSTDLSLPLVDLTETSDDLDVNEDEGIIISNLDLTDPRDKAVPELDLTENSGDEIISLLDEPKYSYEVILPVLDLTEEPVDFPVPKFQADGTITNISRERIESLKSEGIVIKSGAWSESEKRILKRNFENFKSQFGISDAGLLLGIGRSLPINRHQTEIIKFLKAKHFYLRLGQDIQRTLKKVYSKARSMFASFKVWGHCSKDDFKAVIQLQKKYGNNWQLIGHELNISPQICNNIFLLNKKPYLRGKWSKKEVKCLITALKTVTNQSKLNEDDIKIISWQKVSELVGMRNAIQCRREWYHYKSKLRKKYFV